MIALTLALSALAAGCGGLGEVPDFIAAGAGCPLPGDCLTIPRSARLSADAAPRSQVGAHVPATREILMAPDLDTDSLSGPGDLLPERLHAAQYRAGVQTRVRSETGLEGAAYRQQSARLRQKGELRKAMLIDWIADALGRCPNDKPRVHD